MSCVVNSRVNCSGFWFNSFNKINVNIMVPLKWIQEDGGSLRFLLAG